MADRLLTQKELESIEPEKFGSILEGWLKAQDAKTASIVRRETAQEIYGHIRHYCTEEGYKDIGDWLKTKEWR